MSFVVRTSRAMSAAGPLLIIENVSDRVVELLSYEVRSLSGAGGTSAEVKLALDRCDNAGVGTAASVLKMQPSVGAPQASAHDGSTTEPAYGDRLAYGVVNEAAGWLRTPVLEARPRVAPGQGICLRLDDTPAVTPTTYLAEIEFEEV